MQPKSTNLSHSTAELQAATLAILHDPHIMSDEARAEMISQLYASPDAALLRRVSSDRSNTGIFQKGQTIVIKGFNSIDGMYTVEDCHTNDEGGSVSLSVKFEGVYK